MPHPLSRTARAVAAALVAAVGACGGDSGPHLPTTPTPTAAPTGVASGTAFSVVSGETGEAVVGAKVVVGGQTYTSGPSGEVRLSGGAAFGTFVDVTAPSFMDRQTLLRTDGLSRFVLWPRGGPLGIDDWYTAAIVYSDGAGASATAPLRRHSSRTRDVVLVLSPEIANDDSASAQHDFAASLLNEATQGRLHYVLARERPATGVSFDVKVDSGDAQCQPQVLAYASVSSSASEITGGRIVYCNLGEARTSVAVHEVGHTFGLRHSPDGGEVMTGTVYRGYAPNRYSEREKKIIQLMLERRAGNRFPDNDRDVRTAATVEEITICR